MTPDVPSIINTPDSIPAIKLQPNELTKELQTFDWNGIIENLSQTFVDLGLRIVAAVALFYVGNFIIKKLYRLIRAMMLARDMDPSLITFLLSAFRFTFTFILIITVIGVLGIETSSFIAIFASAGVAVGMALSGTLQNFAGGVLILLLKPYKVGDYIEFNTFKGCVKEIQIFHTVLVTLNNETLVIPNGGLSTGSISNYTKEPFRRVEWRVGISYGDDVATARKVALAILHDDPRIVTTFEEQETTKEAPALLSDEEVKKLPWYKRLFHHQKRLQAKAAEWRETQQQQIEAKVKKRDCTPTVQVENLADSSVALVVRGWCASADYWGVFYDIYERIYTQFPQHGLHFPFPQMDVHVKGE